MMDLAEWAANLLLSRGALVEADGNGGIRALLPPSLAEQLGSSEWLSLKFGAEAGADDPGEWLERLGRLVPAESLVAGARLRAPLAAPPLDAAAMLERELVIQNGIYRLVEDFSARASCFFFTFQYTVESDERHLGMVTVCLNASARSLPPQPETLLRAIRDQTEDDPAFSVPVEALAQIYPAALRAAEVETRKLITGLQETARRRLERDARRIDSYYRDLGAQIEKRIVRRSGDPLAAEKERSRLRATELDRAAKLEDLRRKYSLRIRLEPAAVLAVVLPVREISVRLIRKKQERARRFHWNPVLGLLEPPLCDHCLGRAHPVYLCENIHCLCRECWSQCPTCARFYCQACQPRCRCQTDGGAGVS